MKIVFIICVVLLLSFLFGYLGVSGLLGQFYDTLTLLPLFLQPFITIYNVVVSYQNCMIFIMVFLGAHLIRYVLHKLGVYGD